MDHNLSCQSKKEKNLSLGNHITGKLNKIESFTENAPIYFLPLKVLGWILLFLALIVTNLLAIAKWPLSAISIKANKKAPCLNLPLNLSSEEELRKTLDSNEVVLLDFWAQWCGPCLLMNNTINDFAKENADSVTVGKVDVSLNSTLSRQFAVRGLPTVIVFQNGEEVTRKSGSLTKTQLSQLIEQAKV